MLRVLLLNRLDREDLELAERTADPVGFRVTVFDDEVPADTLEAFGLVVRVDSEGIVYDHHQPGNVPSANEMEFQAMDSSCE